MTHEEIDMLVKSWIVDAATKPAQPRVQQIVRRVVGDLCKTIEDLDIAPNEFWHALSFLTEAGKRNELGLLAPGLGFEHFMDLRADEAEARAGLVGATPRTIEGPLYVAGAPVCQGYARLDDGSEGAAAQVLLMQGTVYDQEGQPVPGASVEVWHCNLLGNYSFFDTTQSDFNLRRTIIADARGRYRLRSFLPSGYGCPPGGSTEQLLTALGRHGRRPAHIHFFISADGFRKLTTQINIDGDEYLWDDFAFASREGLVPAVNIISDPVQLQAHELTAPYASIDFDFRVYRETAAVSSSEVERDRAAA